MITKSDAARILKITKQAVSEWDPQEPFFVESGGRVMVDDTHPAWLEKLRHPTDLKRHRGISRGKKRRAMLDSAIDESDIDEEPGRPIMPELFDSAELAQLKKDAAIAEMQEIIFSAKIKEEKSKQEEIKTAEIKKELAPLALVSYFFSFTEKIIYRLYRKPHDIAPQLSALFLAHEDKQAVQLLIRELEAIVTEVKKELIREIETEGYDVK